MNKSSQDKPLQYVHGAALRNSDGTEWTVIKVGSSGQKWRIVSTEGKARWLTKSRLKKYYKLIPHGELQ